MARDKRSVGRHGWGAWCRALAMSFGVSLVVWSAFSWPLPVHVTDAVPLSAKNTEAQGIRRMIEGDHLQLMYHFWLFDDMLKGETPWFHNVYEFNQGDDAERHRITSYYFPFSFFFSVGNTLGGRAFGWNLAGFLAVWFSYILSWLLARRFTKVPWLAWAAATVMLVFPFRWISLLGGSPMGYAMLWSPLLVLGLDLAVRRESFWGGVMAGLAILMAAWSDTHLLFFGVLLVPAYCVLAFLYRTDFRWGDWRGYARLLGALAPVPVLVMVAMQSSGSARRAATEGGDAALGRTWEEVALYSPTWHGLFDGSIASTTTSHIYTGMGLGILLLLGVVAAVMLLRPRFRRREAGLWRVLLFYGLLVFGIVAIVGLALGTNGPFEGKFLLAARKLVNPYRMIRQPAKIFCLLPPLLVVGTVLAYRLLRTWLGRRTGVVVLVGLLAFSSVEAWVRIDASLTQVDTAQGAYGAVAEDALRRGQARPAVLVLPLWPGDSHFGSAYEHYASLYRLRMINGYSPVVPDGYLDGVFWPLESANQGVFSDGQLDSLDAMGVGYVLLHEDMFPEKVSPFPVGQTLQNLLNHPRLERIGRDESVWAFRILADTEVASVAAATNSFVSCHLPARRWELERSLSTNAVPQFGEKSASGEGYMRLDAAGAQVSPRGVRIWNVDQPVSWMLRARGEGAVRFTQLVDYQTNSITQIAVDSSGWQWLAIPTEARPDYHRIDCQLAHAEGVIELDQLILVKGAWRSELAVGESLRLPAATLFHAGYTRDDLASVTFRKDRDPVAIVMYGPMLPLDPGRYAVALHFTSDAPAGTELGSFDIRRPIGEEREWTQVLAGEVARYEFTQTENLPLYLAFVFARNADMTIQEIVFERL
jgi:hypothetical protein